MTWDHPRGMAPLVAAAARWQEQTGTSINWEGRSLQDFESFPVEDLARRYDLIVIDHPHVGQVCAANCLLPLETLLDGAALADVADGSVGGSFESYRWAGHQWALPIDAAAQVQAWVPTRIGAPVNRFAALSPLLREGIVALPLRAPHALMTLFTLCGLAGITLDVYGEQLFPVEATSAYERLAEMAEAVGNDAWSMDPIAAFEAMASPGSRFALAPFIYGYVSYAQDDFRDTAIRFADLPLIDTQPRGSTLGGTGIAVSRFAADPEGAARFASWISSGQVQRDLIGMAGGQPAHALAWEDAGVNRSTASFYAATRTTLDAAWMRPRHDGYMAFQHAASDRLEQALRGGEPPDQVLAALNLLYGASR